MSSNTGVHNPDVIDLVSCNSTSDEWTLIMIETREWDTKLEHLVQLQSKINSYLSFVLDGQLETDYPESSGKLVKFQLNCPPIFDEQVKKFIQITKDILTEYNIEFIVKTIN